jgi:hypothetical protein
MKQAAGIIWFFFGSLVAQDTFVPGKFSLPCLAGKPLLRDELGSLVLLDSDELNKRATSREPLRAENGSPALSSVVVYIALDLNGRVACTDPSPAPKALRAAAAVIARKWRFDPIVDHGRRIRAMGRLEIPIRVD